MAVKKWTIYFLIDLFHGFSWLLIHLVITLKDNSGNSTIHLISEREKPYGLPWRQRQATNCRCRRSAPGSASMHKHWPEVLGHRWPNGPILRVKNDVSWSLRPLGPHDIFDVTCWHVDMLMFYARFSSGEPWVNAFKTYIQYFMKIAQVDGKLWFPINPHHIPKMWSAPQKKHRYLAG